MDQDRNFIKALRRGMSVLTVLNQYNGLDMQTLMSLTGYSRSGLYRIVETLMAEGYVRRSDHDKRYRLTSQTRSLSTGYAPEPWIAQIVTPIFQEETADILWPAALSVWRNGRLTVECSSGHPSTFNVRRASSGWDIELAQSASGIAFLSALAGEEARGVLSNVLGDASNDPAALDRIQDELEEACESGFAAYQADTYRSIAVPVRRGTLAIGALALQGETSTKWPSADEASLIHTLINIAVQIDVALSAEGNTLAKL